MAVTGKDWLANDFPQKNVQQESVDITKFRPKSVLSDENLILEDS